jgi:hypothetical protein
MEDLKQCLKISDRDRNYIAKNGQDLVREKYHYNSIVKMFENEILRKN